MAMVKNAGARTMAVVRPGPTSSTPWRAKQFKVINGHNWTSTTCRYIPAKRAKSARERLARLSEKSLRPKCWVFDLKKCQLSISHDWWQLQNFQTCCNAVQTFVRKPREMLSCWLPSKLRKLKMASVNWAETPTSYLTSHESYSFETSRCAHACNAQAQPLAYTRV